MRYILAHITLPFFSCCCCCGLFIRRRSTDEALKPLATHPGTITQTSTKSNQLLFFLSMPLSLLLLAVDPMVFLKSGRMKRRNDPSNTKERRREISIAHHQHTTATTNHFTHTHQNHFVFLLLLLYV